MNFAETMKAELIKAYIEAYGEDAWNNQSEAEKQNTLHELLGSFLTAARRH